MGFALHPSCDASGPPDALASQGSEWMDPLAKLGRGHGQGLAHAQSLDSGLYSLIVAVRESFMGKDCKPHPNQPDQGLG